MRHDRTPEQEDRLFALARAFLTDRFAHERLLKDSADRDLYHAHSRRDKAVWRRPITFEMIMREIGDWLSAARLPAHHAACRDVLSKIRALILTATPAELAAESRALAGLLKREWLHNMIRK